MTPDDAKDGELSFNPPSELPVLTKEVSRILLDMLIRLTEVEALDGSRGGRADDC